MPIPESQLITWSKQGAIQSSAITHKSVENCIKLVNWKKDIHYRTYLQGSYPNYTNIYGNSDVDLVVEFRSIFSKNLSALSFDERLNFERDFEGAKYSLAEFKLAVIEQLRECYGSQIVKNGNKAILVKGNGNRLDCDVVVCNPY